MAVYFNGGTQPLVPEGKWGEGVYMPGEPYETDAELGPPWTEDEEAARALLSQPDPGTGDTSDSPPEGVSGAEAPSGGPSAEAPTLRTLDNGDVVNEAGQVVGHEDAQPGATAPQQEGNA